MSSAARARRERTRLIVSTLQGKRAHTILQRARVRARLAELDAELKAAADGLDALDRLAALDAAEERAP